MLHFTVKRALLLTFYTFYQLVVSNPSKKKPTGSSRRQKLCNEISRNWCIVFSVTFGNWTYYIWTQWPCSPWVLVAQWTERSDPMFGRSWVRFLSGDSDFFFVPHLCRVINSPFATAFIYLALRKYKKGSVKYLKLFCYKVLVYLKLKFARFPTGFRLKSALFTFISSSTPRVETSFTWRYKT